MKDFIIDNFFLISKLIFYIGIGVLIYSTTKKENNKAKNTISKNNINHTKPMSRVIGISAIIFGIVLFIIGIITICIVIYILAQIGMTLRNIG